MWPAESIMQSMRSAMLCRFPTSGLIDTLSKLIINTENIRALFDDTHHANTLITVKTLVL